MATDLAEFIGAAIGFKLILGVSLLQGAVLTDHRDVSDFNVTTPRSKPPEKVIGLLLLSPPLTFVGCFSLSLI